MLLVEELYLRSPIGCRRGTRTGVSPPAARWGRVRSGNFTRYPTSTLYLPRVGFEHPALRQLVRIILNFSSATGSPTWCRVSFPLSAKRRHTRSSPISSPPLPPLTKPPVPVARRPARVYSTNHQATMRIPQQAATTRGHLMSIPTCVRIGIARPRRLPVRTRVVTASVRTPSVAARFLPAWKLTTSPQSKWNGCACGAACEVGGGELQADELKRR